MVPSSKLSFISNNNNPISIGIAPGNTIHFGSLGFITDRLVYLSLFP
jgi:hypothetical protein